MANQGTTPQTEEQFCDEHAARGHYVDRAQCGGITCDCGEHHPEDHVHGRVGSIIKPETMVLSTGVIDGSRADRDIPRFGADEAGPF